MKNIKTTGNFEAIQKELNEDRFKYYLNDDATLVKLKGHATRAPIEQTPTNDPTHTFQFSSGSFVVVMNPLVNFWKSAQGKLINPKETDNLDTSVKSVKTQKDAGGKITGHITKLSVEGEDVTITTFDTQVKIRVQGGKMQVEYTTRALLPYLEANIEMNSVKIKEINKYFIDHPGPFPKTKLNATHVKVHCHFCKKEFKSRKEIRSHMSTDHNTRTPPKMITIFNSEQQLEPIEDTSLLDTSISSNESLPLEELPLPELTSPSEPPSPSETSLELPSPFETPLGPPSLLEPPSLSETPLEPPPFPVETSSETPPPPSQRVKTSILPEDSFCKEVNTSAPPPPMLWSGRLPVLPASWSTKGGSLPSESLGAILEAIAKVSNVSKPQPLPSNLNLEPGTSDETSHLDTIVAQQELLASLAAGSRDPYPPEEQGARTPLSASPTSGQTVNVSICADTANSAFGQDPVAPTPRTEGAGSAAPLTSLKQKNLEDCLKCQTQHVHECFKEQDQELQVSSTSVPDHLAPAHKPEKRMRPTVIRLLTSSPPEPPTSFQQEPSSHTPPLGMGSQTNVAVWKGLGPRPPTFLQAPLSHHRQGAQNWDHIEVLEMNTVVEVDKPKQSNNKTKSTKKETPGIGKKRLNPTQPSHANFAACNIDSHPQPEEPEHPYGPYECEACDEKFKWAGSVYKHMAYVHGLQIPCDSSDSLLYFLAEQNEEANQKLSETNEKLNAMQEQVAQILNTLNGVKCETCNYTAPSESMLNTHMKLKHTNQEKVSRPQLPAIPQRSAPKPAPQIGAPRASGPQPRARQSANPPAMKPPPLFPRGPPQAQQHPSPSPGAPLFPRGPPQAQQHPSPPPGAPLSSRGPPQAQQHPTPSSGVKLQGQLHSANRPRGKLQHLHIADSVGRNMLYPKLESSSGSLILPRRATPSVYDERAFKPAENVQAVLQRELSGGRKFHTVILGAPTVDITNQDVSNGVLEENTVESVASAYNMVDAANYAIESGQVVQVILMEHAPRYDTPQQDPYEAKPYLAKLANETLRRAVGESGFRDRIMVGSLTGLQVDGRARSDLMTNIGDNWRSRNAKVGKYDGVHYYSKQGQEALTCSMLEVLRQAGLVRSTKRLPFAPQDSSLPSSSPQYSSSHSSSPQHGSLDQWQTVSRGPRGAALAPAPFQIPVTNRFQGN